MQNGAEIEDNSDKCCKTVEQTVENKFSRKFDARGMENMKNTCPPKLGFDSPSHTES